MNCHGCNCELKDHDTIIEVEATWMYCMDCCRMMTVGAKLALDAA